MKRKLSHSPPIAHVYHSEQQLQTETEAVREEREGEMDAPAGEFTCACEAQSTVDNPHASVSVQSVSRIIDLNTFESFFFFFFNFTQDLLMI